MAEKKRPLPKAQTSAFGRGRRFQEEDAPPLMADDITRAAAEGRLEDLFGKEIPDSEQARALVSMMMGLTGMSSFEAPARETGENSLPKSLDTAPLPEEVVRAAEGGDVAGLMGLLQKECEKRSGNTEASAGPGGPALTDDSGRAGRPTIGKGVIDGLIEIASDNDVTVEWLMFRALKVYVREYRETGRL